MHSKAFSSEADWRIFRPAPDFAKQVYLIVGLTRSRKIFAAKSAEIAWSATPLERDTQERDTRGFARA